MNSKQVVDRQNAYPYLMHLACGLLLIVFAIPVKSAPDDEDGEGFRLMVGGQSVYGSTYPGSNEYSVGTTPIFSAKYIDGRIQWYSKILNNGVLYQLNDRWEVGLELGRKSGRDENAHSALAGLGNIKDTYRIGAEIEYEAFELLLFGAGISLHGAGQDLTYSFSTTTFIPTPIQGFGFRFTFEAIYGTQRHLMSQWGVSESQVITSSYSAYTPKAGIKYYDFSLSGKYDFYEAWSAFISARYSNLGDAGRLSPFVMQNYDASFEIGIAYSF